MGTIEKTRCRLCSNLIRKLQFSDNKLICQIRILFHVHIDQNMDDRLPKIVCTRCTNTVNTMSRFYKKVHNAQKKLASLLEIEKNNSNNSEVQFSQTADTICQTNHVQKVEDADPNPGPEPDPQPDSYPESDYADNNDNNLVLKVENDQYSDVINDSPSDSMDGIDNRYCPIYGDTEDPIEIKPIYFVQDSQNIPLSDSVPESRDAAGNSMQESRASDSNSISKELTVSLINKHKFKSKVAKKKSSKKVADKIDLAQKSEGSVLIAMLNDEYKLKNDQPENVTEAKSVTMRRNSPNHYWPEYPWKCSHCGSKCSDVNDYKSHQCFALHQRFHCADCTRSFCRARLLYAHIKEDHWERYLAHLQLECDVCFDWFNSQEEQEAHRGLTHSYAGPRPPPPIKPPKTDIPRPKCDVCGKIYKSDIVLRVHMKNHVKDSEKPYHCIECERRFINMSQLNEHKKIHLGVRDWTCEECGKSFINKGNFNSHMITHSDARPFSCAVCQKTFKTAKRLREHQTLHSGKKSFVCSVCGCSFRNREQLKGHALVHSDNKKYQCDICDKSFRHLHVRDVHRRQHTGEQPYACVTCGRRFTNYSNCSKHMRRVHDVKAPPSRCLITP